MKGLIYKRMMIELIRHLSQDIWEGNRNIITPDFPRVEYTIIENVDIDQLNCSIKIETKINKPNALAVIFILWNCKQGLSTHYYIIIKYYIICFSPDVL